MQRVFAAVLFDWDGTLLDSAEATYRCYRQLFAHYSLAFDHDSFLQSYSPDWYRTYRFAGLAEAHWTEADALWQRFYHEKPAALLPDARETLVRLTDAGLRLGLVTSGERNRVHRELREHDLVHHFQAVVCATDCPHRKPHKAPLELALTQLGVPAPSAAFIGDSPEDIQMARAAGVFAVAIPGGFPNREALAASGADALVPDLAAALRVLHLRLSYDSPS